MSQELIARITAELKDAVGENSGFGSILKIDFQGQGVVRIDGRNVPNSVTNEDMPADCVVTISPENLIKLRRKELDPTMAYMTGKIKVKGDMAVVMKLGPLVQRLGKGA